MKSKKELQEEYRQKTFPMGVFQIRNVVNGKIFVESSVNLDAIWNRHRAQLGFGSHPSKALQQDWAAFGEENFRYEILSEIKPVEGDGLDYGKEVKVLERMYLDELQPFEERGYNQRPKL